jgi:hypothetical protein
MSVMLGEGASGMRQPAEQLRPQQRAIRRARVFVGGSRSGNFYIIYVV